MELIDENSNIGDLPSGTDFMSLLQNLPYPLGLCRVLDDKSALAMLEGNHAFTTMAQCELDELSGKLIHEVFPDFPVQYFHTIYQAAESKQTVNSEAVFIQNRFMTLTAIPCRNNIICLSFNEIYTVASAEAAERKLNRKQSLRGIAKSGCWEVDYQNGHIYCDKELHDLFGFPRDMHIDMDFIRSRIHPEDMFKTERNYIKAIKNNTDFSIVHRFLDQDDRVKHIVQRGATEYDQDMNPRRTVGIAYDVTELKEVEQDLEKSNRILHAVIDSTHKLLAGNDVDAAIAHSLESLCFAIGVTRAYIYNIKDNSGGHYKCYLAHEWTRPGYPALADILGSKNFALKSQSIINNLLNNQVTLLHTHAAPGDCKPLMESAETISLAGFPIIIDNALRGFIGIDDCESQREWSTAEIDVLKLFAETSGLILERREHESELEKAVKRAETNEALLLKSESRQRSLLKALPDMIFIYSSKGYFLDYSVTDNNEMKMAPEEFIGRHVSGFLPEAVAVKKLDSISKVLDSGLPEFYQYEMDINGELIVFDARMVPYGNDATMEIIRNITEQKRMQYALESSENKFKLLFDRMISGAALFEPEFDKKANKWCYRFIDANTSYGKMNSLTRQQLAGRYIDEVFPAMESSWLEVLHEMAHSGNPKVFELFHSDNGKHYHCSAFRPENDKNYFCVIFSDLTAQKQFETELIKAKEKAEESDRLKSSFLSNMSHEIRTPLNTIVGLANLMAENELTQKEKKEYAALINQSSNQLLNLISDIIDIAKIESGQLTLNKNNVYINSVMEKLYDIFSSKLKRINKSRISLDYIRTIKNEDACIYTDETRLTQILTNLLDNAVKFTREGAIEFGCELDIKANELVFFVKDTGSGIAPEKQKIIFERFRQADDSFTRTHNGNGLGLAICKNLTDIMGGRIWLASEPGAGSCFSFTLPYVKKDETPSQKIKRLAVYTADVHYSWPGKTVLIVEDTPTVQFYLKRILEIANIKCLIAANGEEAIELCSSNQHIDLVLMDIQMPVMNGFDATRQLKELDPYLPIIAQTAYAFTTEMEKIASCGCDDCIVKPIKKDILMAKLVKYFGPSAPRIDYKFKS